MNLRLPSLWIVLVSIITVGLTSVAGAQQTSTGTYTGTNGVTAATVGTASAQVLAAAPRNGVLILQNASTAINIACALGAPAVLNAAGSFQIAPGAVLTLSNTIYIPSDAINCIASMVSAPLTILAK